MGLYARRGFTLLEVMVAVTILGLGLTMILSSQVGLFASTQRVQNETVATSLLRCKMSEVEIFLLQKGFPLIEQNDSGDCCEDEDIPGFSCSWKIETIELPQPALVSENKDPKAAAKDAAKDVGKTGAANDPLSALTSGGALAGAGALGALSALEDPSKAKTASSPEELALNLGQASPAGPAGMATVAMGLVYPALKPMMEASIRKVTVQVLWKEGQKEKDFTVVQYITDPRQGSLNPNAAQGLDAVNQMINPGSEPGTAGPGATGSGTTGTSSTSTPGGTSR